MENKNTFIIREITKGIGYQDVLVRYVKESGDPLHDDIPTDLFNPGDRVLMSRATPESEQEFNTGETKKS